MTTQKASLGVLRRNIVGWSQRLFLNLVIEHPYASAHDGTPKQANKDVARIVDTQIHACPAVDERPDDEGDAEQSAPDEPEEEDGQTECVGGMGREETEAAATIAIDNVDVDANVRVAGWPPALHEGLDNHVVETASQEYAEECATQESSVCQVLSSPILSVITLSRCYAKSSQHFWPPPSPHGRRAE